MFVYHQGTDWHALFAELVDQDNDVSSNVLVSNTLSESNQMAPTSVTKKSTPRLLGLFDDLNALTAAMQIIRKIVGPEAGFHILMPTTELTMLPELRAFPPDVQPLFLEGELHSGTGGPYYHMNITGASPSMFHNVCNLYVEQPNQPCPSLVRDVASTTAAVGAGVGSGVAGATAGFMAASLIVGFLPVGNSQRRHTNQDNRQVLAAVISFLASVLQRGFARFPSRFLGDSPIFAPLVLPRRNHCFNHALSSQAGTYRCQRQKYTFALQH